MIQVEVTAPSSEFEEIMEAISLKYEIVWINYDISPPDGMHKAVLTLVKIS